MLLSQNKKEKIKQLAKDNCEIYGHDWTYSPSSYSLKVLDGIETTEIKHPTSRSCERCGKIEKIRG
jgi:hypothetical protein